MIWTRRRPHNEHSIHNLIMPPIIWKSSIGVIRPEALWRPRNPIRRSDYHWFFGWYHGNPASLREKIPSIHKTQILLLDEYALKVPHFELYANPYITATHPSSLPLVFP